MWLTINQNNNWFYSNYLNKIDMLKWNFLLER